VVNVFFLFLILGTEQEWKLAQSTMEAASNGLYSATNELCIASLKAKSASGYMPIIDIHHYFLTNKPAYSCFMIRHRHVIVFVCFIKYYSVTQKLMHVASIYVSRLCVTFYFFFIYR
jgi:hypothetical protein